MHIKRFVHSVRLPVQETEGAILPYSKIFVVKLGNWRKIAFTKPKAFCSNTVCLSQVCPAKFYLTGEQANGLISGFGEVTQML